MKLNLNQVRKLIEWIDTHEETLNVFFPKLKEMKVTLPAMRGKEKELVKTVVQVEDEDK